MVDSFEKWRKNVFLEFVEFIIKLLNLTCKLPYFKLMYSF